MVAILSGTAVLLNPRMQMSDAAGVGEPDGFRAVLEKGKAELVFEIANLPAQRRL